MGGLAQGVQAVAWDGSMGCAAGANTTAMGMVEWFNTVGPTNCGGRYNFLSNASFVISCLLVCLLKLYLMQDVHHPPSYVDTHRNGPGCRALVVPSAREQINLAKGCVGNFVT